MDGDATIAQERPDSPDARALIDELETHLASRYPAASRHGFSVERLVAQAVDFFVLRVAGEPAGCGGILFVDGYGEVKRMYVRPGFRGRGYGRVILQHLADHARSHGVTRLRLETGVHQDEAIGLYEAMGFRRIPPFGPYVPDPLSLCYELDLGPDQDPDLERFVEAQAPVYQTVVAELRAGRKASHWMWFIFPQIAGLGHSAMAQRYAIESLGEARAYLAHPVLGERLRTCAALVAAAGGGSAEAILGPIDALKLRSSMTLFHRAAADEPIFRAVLDRFYDGVPDAATDEILDRLSRRPAGA
ncbi:MAG TPA: GNAT family N-acetyltransferase [Candidatus Sulfotelmatobacter sp.]|nr:GNAT family N-acetyltransferase [Candidatus Sulfotelmatobacter sp.]